MTWLRGPLASRNFALLTACDITSMTGTWMAIVAIPFAVLRAGGSASDVGFVNASALIMNVVFLMFGGVLADRLPRLRVMLAANVLQGSAQAAFAILILAGHPVLWQMMALAAVRGVGQGLYQPAARGLVPQTVPAEDLPSANAVRRIGLNAAQIGGSALGGVIVALVGPGWGLAADATSFAAAVALRAGMRITVPARDGSTTMLTELRQGWRAFTSRRWLWIIVVQFSLLNVVFVGCFMVLGPVVADHHLGGAGSWGTILAVEAIGSVLGAALMIRFRPRRLLLIGSIGTALLILPLVALATTRSVALIAAGALFCGAGSEVFEVNWSTALQEQIPLNMLSRVSSYDFLGSFALAPLGGILAGPVALAIGISATLTGGGVLVAASALAVICVPEVRNLLRQARPAPDTESAPTASLGEQGA
jgi:predicted MFS family arabinose efflux permease